MMNPGTKLALTLIISSSALNLAANEVTVQNSTDNAAVELTHYNYHNKWGIAIGLRSAAIPYASDDNTVHDIVPLIRYENDFLFINGLEAGLHLWQNDNSELNLYSRYRFVDIPKEYQNQIQEDSFDVGLQYRFFQDKWEHDVAFLTDSYSRTYGFVRSQYHWESNKWNLTPYAEIKWKSSDFNNYYYGLDLLEPSAGVSTRLGIKGRYHAVSNLYLIGNLAVSRLENSVADLSAIDEQYQFESYIGFGFFPNPNKPINKPVPKEKGQYLRLAHGWATPSNLSHILSGNTEKDPYNNQLSSLFYGVPLTDDLFSLPLDIYFTAGAIWHHDSEVQETLAEGVIALKLYYTFKLGPRWRIGAAEGLSYITNVTHIELDNLESKDYQPSKFLNYLDFSLDANLGDIFGSESMKNTWLGWSIHHRSGIFETSSAFGRIKGGSNYNTVYLQWHF